ncbi:hypothetical protein DRQ21_11755 [Candidatus Fermentibacteria bacterium]|nr:MAG: hypothetical protein DRQ21_11755 [Candidatus Fermentibacteria bacterium]
MGEYLKHFPPDPMRYALAVNSPETRASDFSWTEYRSRNNELADVLGNFVNRTLKFTASKFNGKVPDAATDEVLLAKAAETAGEIASLLESFKFKKAVGLAMDLAREGNRYFDTQKPWKSLKTDPEQCAVTVASCLNLCASLAVIFEPFIPFSAQKIRKMLGLESLKWSDAGRVLLEPGHSLNSAEILFSKLDEGFEEVMNEQEKPAEDRPAPPVDFEDFLKIEFKVGRILSVEDIKKAKKLYKIQVDTGDMVRTVVAGMKPYYTKEDLQDRLVTVV